MRWDFLFVPSVLSSFAFYDCLQVDWFETGVNTGEGNASLEIGLFLTNTIIRLILCKMEVIVEHLAYAPPCLVPSRWVGVLLVCFWPAFMFKPKRHRCSIVRLRCSKEEEDGGRGGEGEEEGEGCTLSPHAVSQTWLLFLSETHEWGRANKHWPPALHGAAWPAWRTFWELWSDSSFLWGCKRSDLKKV